MFTKAIAVVGASLMLGVFAITTDAFAQGVGSSYTYRVSPSGNLVVRGAPTTGGARVNPSTSATPRYFNANPTPSTNPNNGSNFGASGPYVGLKVITH